MAVKNDDDSRADLETIKVQCITPSASTGYLQNHWGKWGPRGKRRQSREGLNTGSNKESSFKAKTQAKVPNNVYLE